MNDKPVAWMFEKDGAYMCFKHIDGVDFETGIPLYTAPQIKELSDEEIYKLAGEFWIEGSFDDGELDYVGFARAILKKASEK